MKKIIVEFELDIDKNDEVWIKASKEERQASILLALKDLSNELLKIEVSQGVFTLVTISAKAI